MENKTGNRVSRGFFDTPEAVRKDVAPEFTSLEKKIGAIIFAASCVISALAGVASGALITWLVMR